MIIDKSGYITRYRSRVKSERSDNKFLLKANDRGYASFHCVLPREYAGRWVRIKIETIEQLKGDPQ